MSSKYKQKQNKNTHSMLQPPVERVQVESIGSNTKVPAIVQPPSANASSNQTMQQQRAKFALEEVNKAKASGVNKKEYKSYASSLPFMIKANGLGQAAAFYRSKGETHKKLYDLLSDWLKQKGQPFEGKDLLEGITASDMNKYLAAQAEAMIFLQWVKQFTNAFMGDE